MILLLSHYYGDGSLNFSDKFNEKVYSEWIERYSSGLSTVKIAEEYDCSIGKVRKELKRAGVVLRSNSVNSRKYSIKNENFFETIDTEQKAYYLGFMFADGFITSKIKGNGSQSVGMTLSTRDKDVLTRFRIALGAEHPVRDYIGETGYKQGVKYSRLIFKSQKMVEDLKNKGIVEKKTNICEFPSRDILPYNLIKHFIRGYMDGDGSIKRVSRPTGSYDFSFVITGTDDILEGVTDYLIENNLVKIRTKLSKREPHQVVSSLCYGGNIQTERILDHIYRDSTVYLERKYSRYKELKEQNLKSCA